MTVYVALLRGINVGGNHKVPMKDLKIYFEQLGFSKVKTYINSGNVIFSTDNASLLNIVERIQNMLEDAYDFSIPVTVHTRDDIAHVIEDAPAWWGLDNPSIYHNTIFMIHPMTPMNVLEIVGDPLNDIEDLCVSNYVVYWSINLDYFSKSKWSKIASSKVNHNVTLRTANTVKKLYKIMLLMEEEIEGDL